MSQNRPQVEEDVIELLSIKSSKERDFVSSKDEDNEYFRKLYEDLRLVKIRRERLAVDYNDIIKKYTDSPKNGYISNGAAGKFKTVEAVIKTIDDNL